MTDFITLKKGDLEIQILTPHSPIYNRTRFNHAGFIPSIQYKGVQFAEPEQRDPSRQTSGGAGCAASFSSPRRSNRPRRARPSCAWASAS